MLMCVKDDQAPFPRIFDAGYCNGHSRCECPNDMSVIRLRMMPLFVEVGNMSRVLHYVLVVGVVGASELPLCAGL